MAKVMISLPERFLSEVDKAAKPSIARERSNSGALREYFHGQKRSKKPLRAHGYEKLLKPPFLTWKEKFDSTKVIRKMRDSRYSE